MPPAERLGKYELVRHLASGGMARVFLARVSGVGGFERHLVLKTVRPERSEDATFVSMFLDEARLVAMLHHQHVAQVYEVGVADDGTYFLAMEYLHGETVRAILERARDRKLRLPLEFALTVVGAAAAGLHHAHDRRGPDGRRLGIVHRDVTPSNIITGYDGAVKLIDFGIAKALERSTHTKTGFIKGKAGYMAPEQALGDPVDRRADIFSLGVVLYELTTQTRAFPAASELEVAHRIVRGEVKPPSQVVPGFPPVLEDVIMTALERDPDDRFPDADLMGRALGAAGDLLGLTQRPVAVSQVLAQLFGRRPEPWLTGVAPPEDEPPEVTQDTASILQRPARIGRSTGPMFAMGRAPEPLEQLEPGAPPPLTQIARAATEPLPIKRAVTAPAGVARAETEPAPMELAASGSSPGKARPTTDPATSDEDDDEDWMPTVRYLSLVADDIVPEPPPRPLANGTAPPPLPDPSADAAPSMAPGRPHTPRPARLASGTPPGSRLSTPATGPVPGLGEIPGLITTPSPAEVTAPAASASSSTRRAATEKGNAWMEPTFEVVHLRASRRRMLAIPIALGALLAIAVIAIAVVVIGGDDDPTAVAPGEATAPAAPPAADPSTSPDAAPDAPAAPRGGSGGSTRAPAMITLRVTTVPPDATVLLDGERLGPAPITLKVPRESRTVPLKARKKGYKPRRIMIPLDADGAWTIELSRER